MKETEPAERKRIRLDVPRWSMLSPGKYLLLLTSPGDPDTSLRPSSSATDITRCCLVQWCGGQVRKWTEWTPQEWCPAGGILVIVRAATAI
ncbi:hypothetical protein RRG08_012842 [Elysia crispata]|uniref:Uncharacterized protein n=1 Tax=Elysia crispata TaxID=231223 RepID=A0AAE1B751_9GAST|nr:hypothetical protein RRG08_012842 [Elysia crispata]